MTRFFGRRREEVRGVATLQALDSHLDLPHKEVQSLQLLKDQVILSEALLLGLEVYDTGCEYCQDSARLSS